MFKYISAAVFLAAAVALGVVEMPTSSEERPASPASSNCEERFLTITGTQDKKYSLGGYEACRDRFVRDVVPTASISYVAVRDGLVAVAAQSPTAEHVAVQSWEELRSRASLRSEDVRGTGFKPIFRRDAVLSLRYNHSSATWELIAFGEDDDKVVYRGSTEETLLDIGVASDGTITLLASVGGQTVLRTLKDDGTVVQETQVDQRASSHWRRLDGDVVVAIRDGDRFGGGVVLQPSGVATTTISKDYRIVGVVDDDVVVVRRGDLSVGALNPDTGDLRIFQNLPGKDLWQVVASDVGATG